MMAQVSAGHDGSEGRIMEPEVKVSPRASILVMSKRLPVRIPGTRPVA
jgi:hypothetical protein